MGRIFERQEERPSITLMMNDGQEIECEELSIFMVWGQQYIALLEKEDPDNKRGILLYRCNFEEDGSPIFDDIETDEERDLVADELSAIAASQGFRNVVPKFGR